MIVKIGQKVITNKGEGKVVNITKYYPIRDFGIGSSVPITYIDVIYNESGEMERFVLANSLDYRFVDPAYTIGEPGTSFIM